MAQGRGVGPDAIRGWSVASRGMTWLAYAAMRVMLFVSGKRY